MPNKPKRADRELEDEAHRAMAAILKAIQEDEDAGRTQDCLTPWEQSLIESTRGNSSFTEKQALKIIEVYDRLKEDRRD